MKLLLIGFGGVGQELARILTSQNFKSKFPDLILSVTGISTATRGSLHSDSGIDLKRALENMKKMDRFSEDNPDFSPAGSHELISQAEFDILVELSTLSIKDRGQPAADYIESALQTGHDCVSANKGPLAFMHHELTKLAKSNNVKLLFESTVMDGAPIFNLFRNCLRACTVQRIEGVLNATSNYVLEHMENGGTVEKAVCEAQEAGFAEADPRHDLEGWDSSSKIAVLANSLMEASITPLDVEREGIMGVSFDQLRSALDSGRRLKLIAGAKKLEGIVRASVKLKEVPLSDPFARVPADGSIIRIHTDLMGPLTIQQDSPTLSDTAYGVLNDLMEIHEARSLLGRNDRSEKVVNRD